MQSKSSIPNPQSHKSKPAQGKSYYIHTFGCQMNHSDSERFSSIVEGLGYQPTENWKQADLIVFNSCSVRQKAEDRIIGMGPQIGELKQTNPELKVVLSGCMARRTWRGTNQTKTPIQMTQDDREVELKEVMPWVDVVLETKEFGKLPLRLGYYDENDYQEALAEVGGVEHYLSYTPKYKNSFQAFVPISTGCDHFCTFCIVPFARGGEVCRPAGQIIAEVFNLTKTGYKDITLLGQTVNRWVNPKYDEEIKRGMVANTKIPELNTKPLTQTELSAWQEFFHNIAFEVDGQWMDSHIVSENLAEPRDFLQLIQILDQIPGEWWTTWVSSHPNYMTAELIEFIGSSANSLLNIAQAAEMSKVTGHQRPYLHFALQSGSEQILKRMNRRYTYQEFKAVVDSMRQHIRDLNVSTDIIVGFPKETEADLADTGRAIAECEFGMAYIAEFSPREGTAAALIKDDVPREVKEQRKHVLNEILRDKSRKLNQSMIDRSLVVLVEGLDREGYLSGSTANNRTVRIENSQNQELIGSFVSVKITGYKDWSLRGMISE